MPVQECIIYSNTVEKDFVSLKSDFDALQAQISLLGAQERKLKKSLKASEVNLKTVSENGDRRVEKMLYLLAQFGFTNQFFSSMASVGAKLKFRSAVSNSANFLDETANLRSFVLTQNQLSSDLVLSVMDESIASREIKSKSLPKKSSSKRNREGNVKRKSKVPIVSEPKLSDDVQSGSEDGEISDGEDLLDEDSDKFTMDQEEMAL